MSKKKKNDQIPTPEEYIERMLDEIEYKNHIVGKKILENSCGEGNILKKVVKRYIEDAKRNEFSQEEIKDGLERDIIAYEKDLNLVRKCKKNLNNVCKEYQIEDVRWNIRKKDFLKCNEEKEVAFIVGNPPYVTYHDISEEDRIFLKEKYEVCSKGRFDYCYAFIEESIHTLKEDGKMVYLIPFSIFRNAHADNLRTYMKDGIEKIVDFTGIKVFQGITCSVAYFVYKKGQANSTIQYVNEKDQIQQEIQRERLDQTGKKWIFQTIENSRQTFGDYFNIHNSVATLYNKAFLFTADRENATEWIGEEGRVEKEICYPVISTKLKKAEIKELDAAQKQQRTPKKTFIIFPYKLHNNKIEKYGETEFLQKYPKAYQYLKKHRTNLDKRKKDGHAQWFEYGRSQALKEMWDEKLILPMVITQEAKVYRADEKTIPCAGYFVTKKKDSVYGLDDAEKILQSKEFYEYVRIVGTPTTQTSYRISVKDIQNYQF